MNQTRQPPAPPPLMDSPDAREIYASEVVGTGTIGNSVAISLATHRWVVPELGGDMRLARVVVARLVLSNDAALQLSRRLAALARPGAAGQVPMARNVGGGVPRPVTQTGSLQRVPQRMSVQTVPPRPVIPAVGDGKPAPSAPRAKKPGRKAKAKPKPRKKSK